MIFALWRWLSRKGQIRVNNLFNKKTYQLERNLKAVVPLILLISLVIDSALPTLFPKAFIGQNQTIISHLVVYYIIAFAFYLRNSYIQLYALVFGLIADSYNTTLLGIYTVLYFLLAHFILMIRKYFPRNAIIHFMLFIVSITVIDWLVYFFYLRVGYTDLSLTEYILTRLGPTLIFNTALSFFMYLPTRGLLRWLGYDDHIIF